MVETNPLANSSGAAAIGDPLPPGDAEAGAPQPFGNFSGFQPSPLVGLGQGSASADPIHAARHVAGFLLEG